MKNKVLSLVVLFFIVGTISVFAQSKTEEIKIYGECGMCKARIEKDAKAIEGVTKADWNVETKVLEVSYDISKTSSDKIQIAIAKVGHDSDKYRAKDEVYDDLPGCCKYERPEKKSKEMKHKHEHKK